MAGVTATGFTRPTLQELKVELEAEVKAIWGENIDLSPEGPFGQIIGILADREDEKWAAAEAVYAAFTPDGATGAALDQLAAITGTLRDPAKRSTVTALLTGTPTTVVASAKQASVVGTGTRFETTADATIAAATAWAPSTAYIVGDIRTNSGNIYRATGAGNSAAAGGPTGNGSAIVDGTVTWRFIGVGTGYVSAAMQSVDTGPKVANAYSLTVIETAVSGWSGVNNVLDAVLGEDIETDASLRLRREAELQAIGSSPVEAIRAELLRVADVISAFVFNNPTDNTDADGIPPHSIEALVRGGADADIWAALFKSTAAGIGTHGATSGVVTDSQGFSHTVKFNRPTVLPIYVIANVTVDPAKFPADGVEQIRDAIVEFGDARGEGYDVVAAALSAQAFSVPGVLNVTDLFIGIAPGPAGSATITVTTRQIADYDSARVTINTTPGTP